MKQGRFWRRKKAAPEAPRVPYSAGSKIEVGMTVYVAGRASVIAWINDDGSAVIAPPARPTPPKGSST